MASSIFGTTPAQIPSQDAMQQAQQILNTIAPAANPQQMLQNLVKQNPQYNYLMELVNQNNGDIRATVLNLARERGIDINQLYRQFMHR